MKGSEPGIEVITKGIKSNDKPLLLKESIGCMSIYSEIKAQARCKHCGESHPAVLQFHHRDAKEKLFDVSTFVYHQKGGLRKLEEEIAKCDILCGNCHFKYHYDNDQRRPRGLVESVINQIEDKLSDELEQ